MVQNIAADATPQLADTATVIERKAKKMMKIQIYSTVAHFYRPPPPLALPPPMM